MRCKHCKSTNVIKYGKRKNGDKIVQVFKCKFCGRFFSENTTYEKTKLKELAIKVSVNLHLSGLTYRTIQRHLEEIYGIGVSYVTIYNWVKGCIRER
jgi:transposase-like protein